MTLVLPWRFLASSNLRHKGKGHAHHPDYVEARDGGAEHLASQYHGPTITVPVKTEFVFYPPDRRRRDTTNLLKAALDALELSGIVENDCLAGDGGWHTAGPVHEDRARAEITVTVLDFAIRTPTESESSPEQSPEA